MDSINRNQPEVNRGDLEGAEAVKQIRELVSTAKTCFFCTKSESGESHGVRPMSVQKTDENGILWFLSSDDSHKNAEINSNGAVRLFFQGSAHSDFLYLDGEASVSKDPEMIKELWEPILKTWFTEGETDPRITVIRFEPQEGYYWDTKHGNFVAGAKMLVGAVIGKTLDDSIEGTLAL